MYGFGFNCQHFSSASSAVLVMMWLGSVRGVLVVDCTSENTQLCAHWMKVCVLSVCVSSLSARGVKCVDLEIWRTLQLWFSVCFSEWSDKVFVNVFILIKDRGFLYADRRDQTCFVFCLMVEHDCCLSCSVLYIFFFFWMSNALFQITIEWPRLFLKVHFNRDIRKKMV